MATQDNTPLHQTARDLRSVPNMKKDSAEQKREGEASAGGHTPGPWAWRNDPYDDGTPYITIYPAGQCHRYCGYNTETKTGIRIAQIISEPDARLIAAAPDMYTALELAADYIKDLDGGDISSDTGWKSDELLDVWLKARAALARATGAP